MTVSELKDDCQRLNTVRAAFVAKGSSLNAWCNQNKVDYANARRAITGTWNGPKAKRLLVEISQAAGVPCK